MSISTATPSINLEYAELKRRVKASGLLDRQPVYYIFKTLSTFLLLVAGMAFMVWMEGRFWLQLLAVPYFALIFAQLGLVGHDAAHRQIFKSVRNNDILFMFMANFMIGMNFTWWTKTHNTHHANPNHEELDPDINFEVFGFSQRQIEKRKGIYRLIVAYQAFLFFPMNIFAVVNIRGQGIKTVIEGKARYPFWEGATLLLHHVAYIAFLLIVMNPWQALIWGVLHLMVLGFHLGSIFAPNHKGMEIVDDEAKQRLGYFREQVITARNIKPGVLVDFVYGGLNYQIEHHLFPSMPRNNLGKVKRIVEAYCKELDVPYHEAGLFQTYWEIVSYLHEISAPLRKRKALATEASGI